MPPGIKKVPSGCPGQVEFPVRQVTFHSHLGKVPGQAKFESYLSKGQAGIQVFFKLKINESQNNVKKL